MADTITSVLKKLLSEIHAYNSLTTDLSQKEQVHKIGVCYYFIHLMDYLARMIRGFVNEEMDVLFYELRTEMDRIHNGHFVRPLLISDMIFKNCEKMLEIRYGSNVEGEETVVGFDEETETLLDQLTTTCTKQLQVILIAGMAGLGKTTLARKLYMDPLINYMFDFQAWICVSQTYLKRDLLRGILSSFIVSSGPNHTHANLHIEDLEDDTYKMTDEQLGEMLYKLIKGRKYLVVLDDIWDCMSWNDLRVYFPDDNVGSRVLFTSRDTELTLHVKAAEPPHVLRLRTEEESWNIFLNKVFRTGVCPNWLEGHGKVITRKCEGLPLAIVITAGLLKNNWSNAWWFQISESLHSFVVRDPKTYMDSLALSYNHLPPHLRQCFVFVGVFLEDYDIQATKLMWLWIAQGFVQKTENRTLEDVAEDFLMDLIKRSLLMTAKKRADGHIKTCRIHDLLRDLCLTKAYEENFSQELHTALSSSRTMTNMLHSMSQNPPALPSEFRYPFEFGEFLYKGQSFDIERYKTIKILDVESVPISLFPCDVIQLVNLRYLAIQAHDGSPKASISSLFNLQMLIISSRKNIVVPNTIWSMVNLRHLYIKTGVNLIEDSCLIQETEKVDCPSRLGNLQTLSQVSPQSCHHISLRTPNLRKLGICGPLVSSQGELELPNIRSLRHLEKLKLLNTISYGKPTRLLNTMMFPEKLKKLTLSNTCMEWEDMWAISLLLNLEFLKLNFHACIGETWETSDAEFKQLKILKIHGLNLRQWVCSRENFPRLKRLAVRQCLNLNTIPSDLGKIITLEVIEVQSCSNSVEVSALKIQEEHESEGNFFLKVHATNNL